MSTNKNLQHSEAAKKLKELVEDIDICLFCTDLQNNDGLTARPMSSQKVDEEGNIWFFSDKNSDKNRCTSNHFGAPFLPQIKSAYKPGGAPAAR